MTSIRQLEANRRNAIRSTGPTTEAGKHRSRRNAVRHVLCAETVVEMIEDIDDYRGFEAAVIADNEYSLGEASHRLYKLCFLIWMFACIIF
jgi:hypothetical protein